MLAAHRRRQAIQAARGAGADGMLVTHGPDVRWLTGFTGSNGAVALAGGRAALFTDGRYTTQARAEAPDLRIVVGKRLAPALAVEWLAARGVSRCAFDARQTSVAALEALRKALAAGSPAQSLARPRTKSSATPPARTAAPRRAFFQPTEGLVARLREIKDEDEIGRMRRAAALGCSLYQQVLAHLVPGQTEIGVALELEYAARQAGAEAMSFETIVASGKRSALPHGRATAQKLPRRGFVTLDFGVLLDGYCSDMTRTVHLGRAGARARDVYHAVLEAQEAAVAAVAPGVRCAEIDAAARSVLQRAGLGKAFAHSTGHGVGLEIHEGPRLAAGVEQVLEPGMIITVEPGAYLAGSPEEFGVRIEDMVLVTEDGADVLTAASPKAWTEL